MKNVSRSRKSRQARRPDVVRPVWRCGKITLFCGRRPHIMGIVNVTPDSFADGGRYDGTEKAVKRAVGLIRDGATIVDVGGESTRPGAEPVPADREAERVIPVIKCVCDWIRGYGRAELRGRTVMVSVDTMKSDVARKAIAAGASIINDVSAMTHDPAMAGVALETGAGVVLMHMLGNPRVMQKNPKYDNVVREVFDYLAGRIENLTGQGLDVERIAVDPGIGFGKTLRHNLQLLGRLDELRSLGRPVVAGMSRKSFIGRMSGRDVDNRLAGSIAAAAFCVTKGVHVLRVHDVAETLDAVRVTGSLAAHSDMSGDRRAH